MSSDIIWHNRYSVCWWQIHAHACIYALYKDTNTRVDSLMIMGLAASALEHWKWAFTPHWLGFLTCHWHRGRGWWHHTSSLSCASGLQSAPSHILCIACQQCGEQQRHWHREIPPLSAPGDCHWPGPGDGRADAARAPATSAPPDATTAVGPDWAAI